MLKVKYSPAYRQIVHYFDHGYLEEEKSMIHSFTVTFGEKYLTGMDEESLYITKYVFHILITLNLIAT
jgi:hypothetical protein